MENIPIVLRTHIYDYLSGDAVYWKTEFNKVIQYINIYSDDIRSDMLRIAIYDDEDYIDLYVFNILKYYL